MPYTLNFMIVSTISEKRAKPSRSIAVSKAKAKPIFSVTGMAVLVCDAIVMFILSCLA
jgi:hypothetical protein